jgi:O-antigen ligase
MFLVWTFSGIYLGALSYVFILLGILALMSRARYAEILLGFWLFLMFSDNHFEIFDFAKSFKPAYMSLLAFIVVVHRGVINTTNNIAFKIFLPFFLWAFLILYDNPEVFTSLQKTFSYAFLFFSVPVIMRYLFRERQSETLRTFYFIVVSYLALGLIMKYVNPEFAYLAGRFRGLMGNPNGLGVLVLIIALFFDTVFRKAPDQFGRQEKVVFWVIVFANLLLCQSRSSLFALILYLVFSNFNALKGFLGVLVFTAILFSYQFVMNNLPVVIQALGLEEFFRLDTLEGGSGRLLAWTFAWEQIQDNFFIGRGFNYTEWIFGINYKMLANLGHQGNAHNSYLTFWLDMGLIGLIIYLLSFFMLFIRTSKVYSNAIPVMYAILFSVSFESWLTASLNPFTIGLLMTISVMLYANSKADDVGGDLEVTNDSA